MMRERILLLTSQRALKTDSCSGTGRLEAALGEGEAVAFQVPRHCGWEIDSNPATARSRQYPQSMLPYVMPEPAVMNLSAGPQVSAPVLEQLFPGEHQWHPPEVVRLNSWLLMSMKKGVCLRDSLRKSEHGC